MDSSTRRKLDDFRRALSEAISDSNEAARRLYELRREGFDLYLLLDGSGRELPGRTLEDDLLGDQALQRLPRALPVRAPRASGAAAGNGEAPQFRITSDDVSWLRSLGIDPTRKTRRRRNDPR
jgi:hypothetical protein